MRFDRSVHHYLSTRDDQAALRQRMKELAGVGVC
jgi:hypothetical protein